MLSKIPQFFKFITFSQFSDSKRRVPYSHCITHFYKKVILHITSRITFKLRRILPIQFEDQISPHHRSNQLAFYLEYIPHPVHNTRKSN